MKMPPPPQPDLFTDLERAAWQRYKAATDGPWEVYDKAFLDAWEQASDEAEFEALIADEQARWAVIHRTAWQTYLAEIAGTPDAERHQPGRYRVAS